MEPVSGGTVSGKAAQGLNLRSRSAMGSALSESLRCVLQGLPGPKASFSSKDLGLLPFQEGSSVVGVGGGEGGAGVLNLGPPWEGVALCRP